MKSAAFASGRTIFTGQIMSAGLICLGVAAPVGRSRTACFAVSASLRLLPPISRDIYLAVRLAVPLAGPAEDFRLLVSAPCRAHHKKTGRRIILRPVKQNIANAIKNTVLLEQPCNLTGVRFNIHPPESRIGTGAGHEADGAGTGAQKFGA